MPECSPIDYAVPGFILLVLAEMVWSRLRSPHAYEPKDTAVSLAFGLGSTIAGALTAAVVLAMLVALYRYRLLDSGWQWWA